MSDASDIDLPSSERIARAIEARADEAASDDGLRSEIFVRGEDGFELGLREAARIARETDPWIAVGDGLPDPTVPVLTYREDPRDRPLLAVAIGYCHTHRGWAAVCGKALLGVTHWTHISPPPTEGADR